MTETAAAATGSETITIVLRGYFSRRLPKDLRSLAVPLAEAPTVQAALARAGVPVGAVGLLLVNRQTVSMDAALHAGDTLEVLPLLGGG